MLGIPKQAVMRNNRSVVGAVLAKQKGMFARANSTIDSTIDSTTEPKRNFYSATTPVSPTIEPAATLVINDTTPKSVESKDSFNIDRQSNKNFNSEESPVSPSSNKEQLELSEIQLKPEEFGRLFSNFRDNASAVDSEQVIDILGNLIKKLGGTVTRATGSISLLEHRYNEFVKLLMNKKFRDYQDGSTSFNVPQDVADEIMLVFAKLAEYDYEIAVQPQNPPQPDIGPTICAEKTPPVIGPTICAEKTPPVIGPTPSAEKTAVEIIEDETKKQADKLAAAAKEIAIKNKTGIIIGISLALLIYLATRGRK